MQGKGKDAAKCLLGCIKTIAIGEENTHKQQENRDEEKRKEKEVREPVPVSK